MYPSLPIPFISNFSLAGKMVGKSAILILNFGFGKTIVYSKRIEISTNNVSEYLIVSRLWAEKKIAELSLAEEKNKNEITKTGKDYGIVTRNTSLIVLETLQDYIRYKIVPPREMQTDYFNQMQTVETTKKDRTKQQIDRVVALSNEQSNWWNTNYPIQPEIPINDTKTGMNQATGNQNVAQQPTRVVPQTPSTTQPATIPGQILVTGVIMDGVFGGGLPGAIIVVKGTSIGTVADIDGKYSINVPNENSILVFKSIGFVAQSIKVGNKRQINLTLRQDVKQIEEVVKVGYGVQKKSDVTGSVSQNSTESITLESMADMSVAESPAASSSVLIRGIGSFNSEEKSVSSNTKADIQLNAWDPQTPYLKVLQYASKGQEYQSYVKLKLEYGSTPSFYIDASDFFAKIGKVDTAVIILSNLAELSLESPQLLRILGQKLLEFKRPADAVMVYERLLELKGEEPQTYRDLGLAYEANGKHQQAIDTLYEVVKRDWDGRFNGIELIVMNDINAIITSNPKLNVTSIDKRLLKQEPVDIRVILMWDTDNCDVDLWVTDQTKEKCYYGHKLTQLGGKISNDFTGGYGPEEFMIKKAGKGEYQVQSNYFGTRSQSLLAPVNLHMVFYTNFGKPNQKSQDVVIRVENKRDIIDVGSFKFSFN